MEELLRQILEELKSMKALQAVPKDVLNAKSAAEYLNISYFTLLEMLKENHPNRLPHFRVGVKPLFRVDSLDEWMKSNEVGGVKVVEDSKIRRIKG